MDKPKHPRTIFFAESKLFDGLTSFGELEDRISALPTAEERGDAFEVFAEAYFATQRIAQAKAVWPFDAIPLPIKERLSLGQGRDLGVDGIFETLKGEFHAYQVKFRSGRPRLTWSELSTFMGLTDQVDQRVIFTNCDLPEVLTKRKGFYCVRLNDLERLEERDFEAIRNWLKGAPVERKRKEPLPEQLNALSKIVPALTEGGRATVLMPCGTGKTLVALWAAEQLGYQKILVLVPSLALLSQTLVEWMKETRFKEKPIYHCVCSDPTVVKKGEDEIILHQSDVPFPVDTDSDKIRKFFEATKESVKIVFSTYQSARVVAEGMPEQETFDLAIFDEAHKTAGREGVTFGFALEDKNLPIARRLFLTATPRHYDVRQRDKEGDAKLVYSMDVPEVYGPPVYELSFAKAVAKGMICKYKVIISVITSEMVNDELLRRGEVIIGGDVVRAGQVANQIALKSAIENCGTDKIITFHKSVASATSFTGKGSEGITTHIPDLEAFHVNGAMPIGHRDEIMRSFRDSEKSVISNARCLTEGVDIPVVDMVAFLAPKRSKIDIVQATGRAMRKTRERPEKTTGYVLMPLFVEQATGESIEDAVARSEFDQVWTILQAMQEQDEVLADIISQMQEDRGRTKGFDDRSFRERVVFLGPELSLDTLRHSITTKIIDRIGKKWDERFGELQAYKDQHGHCCVPQNWPENQSLAFWVSHQRMYKRQGKLSRDLIRRLDEIGFIWDPHEATWEEQFAELKEFRDKHGHCNISEKQNRRLVKWARYQRMYKRQGKLSEERIRRLDGFEFIWDPYEATWEDQFAELKEFRDKHGHCNISEKHNRRLIQWARHQRRARGRGTVSEERIRRLDEIGFIRDPYEATWEERFAELLRFKDQHGHCNVPRTWSENPNLAVWVNSQRSEKRKGTLSEERIRRLDEIGFIWNLYEATWEERFAELLRFKDQHGHCNVPRTWSENPNLAVWVKLQRREKRKGTLSEERIRRLDEIGFIRDPYEATWEERFAELLRFKDQHGHCNVPRAWPEIPRLTNWVYTQRKAWKKGTLSEEKIRLLNSIRFEWEQIVGGYPKRRRE